MLLSGVQTWHLRHAGGDGFIPGGDYANLCVASWNKAVSAWHNSPCLDAALVFSFQCFNSLTMESKIPGASVCGECVLYQSQTVFKWFNM